MAHFKGITYGNDAFPSPYQEATANSTQVFFGSDNACQHMAPLWGSGYQSGTGAACSDSAGSPCRYDLGRMQSMGVELVRLYDWDPRNPHEAFLDDCHRKGMGVLVSVSNYFLNPGGGFPDRNNQIPALINSYSQQGDYHPAVAGIIFGNELANYGVDQLVGFTQSWVQIQQEQFPTYRPVPIGHPISFASGPSGMPCWDTWNALLPSLDAYKSRLFLAPQTYNEASYLFENAEGRGKGWVDQTYDKYKLPILFTEIGFNRITRPNDYEMIVKDQLSGCINYNRQNPEKLIGACFFSYADKVWMQGHSEGSFGAYTHAGPGPCTITYTDSDFSHRDYDPNPPHNPIPLGTLNVDDIKETPLYAVVKGCYKDT
jgi:hypothetical protein